VSMPDVLLQTTHAREGYAMQHYVLHCRCQCIRSSFSLCSKKLLQQRHAPSTSDMTSPGSGT
jgi:hypothetical protein